MADASLALYLATPHRLVYAFTPASGSGTPTAQLDKAQLLAACVDGPLKTAIDAWPAVATDAEALAAVVKPDQGVDPQAGKKPAIVKRRIWAGALAPTEIDFKNKGGTPGVEVASDKDTLVEIRLEHTING